MPTSGSGRLSGRHLAALLLPVLLLVAISALSPSQTAVAHAQAREVASYDLAVKLDAGARSLAGSGAITFRNATSHTVQDLYLHIYPNAFRGPESTFMRENPAEARRAGLENNWGGMDVTALRLASGQDLLPRSSVDDTIMKVPLPQPLNPGETLRLEVQFTVKLPKVIARTGYLGDHFTIAQWFPKLAALTEKGWVAHQYHANSEFFADFGNYRVEITLPERFVVGATGVLTSERSGSDGTRSFTYVATGVHDFALVANPDFRETRARAGGTEIRLLYQPSHEDRKERFLQPAIAAVENFGRWYGPYPYPVLTVVDAPNEAGSGMEYPTLVTVGGLDPPIPGLLLEEQVTIHEIAHQWWYGMVASNEFEEAWLDEGFATYSTRKLVDMLYSRETSMGNLLGVRMGQLAVDRAMYLAVRGHDPLVQDSWKFGTDFSYQGNVYGKASLVLGTLEGYLGAGKMAEVLRSYFQRFAFKHPTSQDFVETVHAVSGQNFDRFFRQALHLAAVFDYAAGGLEVSDEGSGYKSRIEVRRLGDGVMPVEVVTAFEDGSRASETWDGEAERQAYEYVRPSPAVSVEVDPERKLQLDAAWVNNGRTAGFNFGAILRRAGDLTWLAGIWTKLLGFWL